ncbi:MAG TPA: FAD-binding oxidoreductase [Methylomirabilota bacterium]|nr:FAD-binding oxidoreductase [Methylomirabilota bacterium]
MAVAAGPLGGALVTIAGRDHVRDDEGSLAAASMDGLRPRWVVRPDSVEALSRVIALAHDGGLAVVPRGSASALELGNPPTRLDIVVDLSGLDRTIEYNPDDVTITVQAGATAGALAALLAPRRQWLPIDPPGVVSRTLGGVAATNAGGPLRARFGGLRDLLLGARFVQPDGVVTWGGSKVVKSVSGYDVPKLMVGALGTLGVLAELTLRLHPLPETERSWLVVLDRPAAAQDFVARLVDSPLQPSRVELVNDRAAKSVLGDPGSAGVAVSIGSVADAVREQGERLGALAKAGGAEIVPLPDGFWPAMSAAMVAPSGATVLQVASLAGRLADTVEAIAAIVQAAASGADVRLTGCAALGTLRLVVVGASVAEMTAVTTRVRAWVGELGGSVVIASGPVELRRAVDPWGPIEPGALGLMRALRDEFDPKRVLNPGRYVGGL